MKLVWPTALIVTASLMLPSVANSAEALKNPESAALAEQKDVISAQKGVVEAQRQLLEEQKKLVDAMFPSLGDKGKTGTISQTEKPIAPMHAQFHAYRAAAEAAKQICSRLSASVTNTEKAVVVFTDDELTTILRYQWVIGAIERFTKEFQKLTPGTPEEAAIAPTLFPYFAANALTAIADFTRLFRTDKKIYPESPTVDVQDLVRLIASCPSKGLTVTTAESVIRLAFNLSSSELVKKIELLDLAREGATAAVAASNRAKASITSSDRSRQSKNLTQSAADAKKSLLDDGRVSKIQELDKHVTKLLASILEPEDAQKPPLLGQLLVGEVLTTAGKGATNRMVIHKVSPGGSSLLSQSIWRSDRLYSSGGVNVAFSLINEQGKIISAGTVTCETPYIEVEQVRQPGDELTGKGAATLCR